MRFADEVYRLGSGLDSEITHRTSFDFRQSPIKGLLGMNEHPIHPLPLPEHLAERTVKCITRYEKVPQQHAGMSRHDPLLTAVS
jgi:hypothetical protein